MRTVTDEATAARAAFDFAVGPPAEPHRARAARILAVHPEIRRCVGRNPWSAAVAAGLAALQSAAAVRFSCWRRFRAWSARGALPAGYRAELWDGWIRSIRSILRLIARAQQASRAGGT